MCALNHPHEEAESPAAYTPEDEAALLAKPVFSTGDVAYICKISQQTVIRCFDTGKLHGFRVPGSKFRRIPRESLIAFMKKHDIPLEKMETGKKRVLIVDDDVEIVEMLQDLLTRNGRFEIRTASNGFDAGVLTKEFKPDILLLDYMLPDINGNIVCQRIRQDPQMAGIKIIIVSGAVAPNEIEKLRAAGADDFVKKPFDMEQLIARMMELMRI